VKIVSPLAKQIMRSNGLAHRYFVILIAGLALTMPAAYAQWKCVKPVPSLELADEAPAKRR
jgi:hypothetical protein